MNSLEVYFKNLMNESFAKDISKKVRTSFEISKKNGNFIGVVAPFGYLKDPYDCHKFIIDKEAEKIVKKIFKLALNGISRQDIANELNKSHIPTPSKYMKSFCKKKSSIILEEWNVDSIDNILRNRTYIGNLIQGKTTRISHKKHNIVTVPEDEWIVVPDHHKAIIEEEIFEQVQNIVYNRNSRVSSNGKFYKYTGYLKCADCNSTMKKFSRPNSNSIFFYCSTYIKNKECHKHYITENDLDNTLLEIINKYIEVITNLSEKINNDISISYMEYEKENKEFKLIELDKEEQKYMAFEATKREWGELYAFFRLLADGYVYAGTPDVKRNEVQKLPVAMVQREEHDGTRRYILEDEATVRICGEKIDKQIPREDFAAVAELVFAAVKESRENDVMSPDGVEEFLDEVAIYDLEAKTDDRTDFYVAFYSIEAPLVGFCVRSRLGTMFPLLDGGRTANLKFEQTGVKFATPTVNKINAFGEEDDVAGRMLMIERLGGILKYNDVADKVFRSNLCMIDLHFPRMLGEMLRVMHLDGISKVSDLTEAIKQINPLKIKDELIHKHSYYEYKMKQFLMALALGMRPAKIFNGIDSAISGFLFVNGNGEVLCYQKADRQVFADFLFVNSRFEKSSTEKDKYGYLERENGVYYFKLNLKIGLLKR